MESFASFMGSSVSGLFGSRRNREPWDPNAYVCVYQTNDLNEPKTEITKGNVIGGCNTFETQIFKGDSPTVIDKQTVYSPAYSTITENLPQAFVESHSCVHDIPAKELRQVREDLGGDMADRGRWGRGAGDGVSASLTEMPLSGTQQVQHGPVSVSGPAYSNELYDQGFISMSAVPMVRAGRYRDPVTGVEYDTYESAMPPPDSDYEESVNAPGRNVKLAHIQGGWSDTTARPTKREVLEDDFNLQYDRSINTYGTYDASRLVERFERNNRFTRDDEHPDPEGPILVGAPANQDGNQGNVKIRYLPYVVPTNRGKWAETTFRNSIDPGASLGNTAQMVSQTFTNWPCARMENTRQDGGGVHPTVNTQGFVDMQVGDGRRDIMNTQRSANEGRYRYSGPAGTFVNAEQMHDAAVELPTGFSGLDAYDGVYGAHGSSGVAPGSVVHGQLDAPRGVSGLESNNGAGYGGGSSGGGGGNNGGVQGQVVYGQLDVSCGVSGLDAQDASYYGSYGGSDGEQQRDMATDVPTRLTGMESVDLSSFTGLSGGGGGGGGGGGQSVRLGTEIVETPTKQTGMSPIDASRFGGVNDQNAAGQQLRTSIAHLSNRQTGMSPMDASGFGGVNGHASGQQVYPRHFDTHTSKTGLGAMGESSIGAGLAGVMQNGVHAQASPQVVTIQSRAGVDTVSMSSHGSYGGMAAPHGQSVQQMVVQPTAKSGMAPSAGVPYGSGRVGAGGISEVGTVVLADSYNLRGKNKLEKLKSLYAAVQLQSSAAQTSVPHVTTFNGKKGEENSIRIPSSSLYGSENSGYGMENWAVSTQLDSKREHGYNAAAISPITDDSTRYLGHYNQTVETLNSRQFSNFSHPVASASMADFMQEREMCGL